MYVYTFPAFLITKLEVSNQLNQLFMEGEENIRFVNKEFIKTNFEPIVNLCMRKIT
jgi:hypothetical protein